MGRIVFRLCLSKLSKIILTKHLQPSLWMTLPSTRIFNPEIMNHFRLFSLYVFIFQPFLAFCYLVIFHQKKDRVLLFWPCSNTLDFITFSFRFTYNDSVFLYYALPLCFTWSYSCWKYVSINKSIKVSTCRRMKLTIRGIRVLI